VLRCARYGPQKRQRNVNAKEPGAQAGVCQFRAAGGMRRDAAVQQNAAWLSPHPERGAQRECRMPQVPPPANMKKAEGAEGYREGTKPLKAGR